MSVARFYLALTDLKPGMETVLPSAVFHHAVHVLRLQDGDVCRVFNGDGYDYEAVLFAVNRRSACLRVTAVHPIFSESPLDLILYLAVIKSERMDWAVQKAVELGVNVIVPFYARHSAVRLQDKREEARISRWRQIVQASAEQSGRACLPEVQVPIIWEEVMSRKHKLRLICHPYGKSVSLPQVADEAALLIGPEAGFCDAEFNDALSRGWLPLSLGKRILRAETAALAGLAWAQTRFGDAYVA